jgi:hypothetical protein
VNEARRQSNMTRRLVAMVVAVLLSVIMSAPAPSAAWAEDPPGRLTCTDIKFFGVHGLNEEGPSYPGDELGGVGATVRATWKAFEESSSSTSAVLEAVDFPKSTLDFSVPSDERDAITRLQQVLDLEAGADKAAAALSEQIWATYQRCGARTRYVLVGYSQGAWAIDKALRGAGGLKPVLPAVLELVAGVYLMGDPAWPRSDQWPGRAGLATLVGRGVSDPYRPAGVADRFKSVCVTYPGDVHDAVCMFDWNLANLQKNLDAHYTYKEKASKTGGEWLASLVSP